MTNRNIRGRVKLGSAIAALAIGLAGIAATPAAAAQPAGTYKPTQQVMLSVGEGQMVNLSRPVADVWVSNPAVADVHVTNTRSINLFGKAAGEATVIATARDGSVVYATNVRINQNITSVDDMLRAAMPDSSIQVQNVGQIAVLTGTVGSPEDSAFAEQLVRAALNPGVKEGEPLLIVPVNRIRTATPLQVNLKVRIAEVNRSLLKQIGVNLLATDPSSGFQFGIAQGQGIRLPDLDDPNTGIVGPIRSAIGSTLSGAGSLFGLDLLASIDLAEVDGLVTTLAEPNLTALSGETASFLAGGEFPIPVSQTLGTIAIEYKQYGVGLAFTPIVLADGRISMRVRPEVSELSTEGAIKLNGFDVPALTTRRAETTVELGSGQSFMLAGLLRNHNISNIDKAPFLGDLPILGTLFRSTSFRRQETELVIIVTPYLVRPVSGRMALPTDGYRAPTDPQRILEGQSYTGARRAPVQSTAPVAAPGLSGAAAVAAPGFKL
ncbi:MAG: type II and III secretion system protein family protein [Pseudomonadota bacterium]|nr:type II and III secretion system protein family protein [Pseudomonadota bacterium]